MKKLLFIIFALGFTSAFSQSFKIETITGGALFIKVSSSDTSFYSSSSEVFAYIDRSGKVSFSTKLGGQIGPAYLYSDISLDGATYATKPLFLAALDALDFFSPLAGGGNLWTTSGGYYEPTETKGFQFESGNFTLLNDTAEGGGGINFPYVGELASDYGDYKGYNGFVDLSGIGGQEIAFIGWIDFATGRNNTITINDTLDISLQHKDVEVKVNSSGLVLPNLPTAPTGENGAMYYNTTTNHGQIYRNGTWHNL
tara:strand:+ start:1398 stop:2162 length:765 start_codon:yes stop_codon:yes gene_type:complete